MIVVSTTSPLTNLAAIGHFELLQTLFAQLHIPSAVWEELNAFGTAWPGRNAVASAKWIQRHSTLNSTQNRHLINALERDLDRGESAAIALALEVNADLILLDEYEGRRVAQRLGLRVMGVVGILLSAKQNQLVDEIQPMLHELRTTAGFYLSDAVYRRALSLAGESRK